MEAPLQDFARLFEIARGYQRSRALTIAAELGIADRLRDGPRSAEDLAGATATHAPTLYRLLRALASIGVFHEDAERRFSLTPMSQFLRTDVPLSLDPVTRMFGGDYEWNAWGELLHSVRTGENAATRALGMDVWEYRRQNPVAGETFDAAMRTMSRSSAPSEIAACDFGRFATIADIAGGTGAMLATVLRAHPQARGVLFDQPQVVAGAPPVLREAGVADRVTIVPGSFFEHVPSGADAYILRRILHDWMDDACITILRCIRRAIAPGARLLVIDCVVGPPNEDQLSKFLDLMMLVSAGGKERTEPEWRALFAAGGFTLESVTPAGTNSFILIGVPA